MTTTRKWARSSAIAALVAAGGFMIHQAALAEDTAIAFKHTTTHTETVRYDDLDLSENAGLERLHARIASAAKRACGPVERRNLRELAHWQQCYDQAMSDAIAQVDDERFVRWADTTDASRARATL